MMNTKREYILFSLFFLTILTLQTTVLPFYKIFGTIPELTFCAVLCYAMFMGEKKGAIAGLIMGILYDAVSSNMSFNAILFMLCAYMTGVLIATTLRRALSTAFVITALGILIQNLLIYFLLLFLSNGSSFLFAFKTVVLPKFIVSMIFVFPIYSITKKIYIKCNYKRVH